MKTKAVKKKGSFMKQLKRDRSLWLFCLPGVILTFIFSYIPMYGVQIAFRRFNAKAASWGANGWAFTISRGSSSPPTSR